MGIYPSTSSKRHLPIIYKAEGSYAYGTDGRKYLDFTGSNNTVILGHKKFRFANAPNFPGVSYLEREAVQILKSLTNRDLYRFFKNGSDAVSCAIRLARHIISTDYGGGSIPTIGFIGYGIPDQRTFQVTDETSCDILVYESRHQSKADNVSAHIKICDHLKSGMKGLTENQSQIDLYGKSIANGYPLAIISGDNDIMERINEIYYSTTFGGDNVGLEAFIKTYMEFTKVYDKYDFILRYAEKILPKKKSISEDNIKEFIRNGILYNGEWQIMATHTINEVNKLLSAIDDIM